MEYIEERGAMQPVIALVVGEFATMIDHAHDDGYRHEFGAIQKADTMREIIGKAIRLAQAVRISAQELALCFSEACQRTGLLSFADAWFDRTFRYAEFEFGIPEHGGAQCTWGMLPGKRKL